MSAHNNRKDHPARMKPAAPRRRIAAQLREKPSSRRMVVPTSQPPARPPERPRTQTPPSLPVTPWEPDNLSWLDGLADKDLGASADAQGATLWDSLFFLDADLAEVEEQAGDVGDVGNAEDDAAGWSQISVASGTDLEPLQLPDDPDEQMALLQNLVDRVRKQPDKKSTADLQASLSWIEQKLGDEPPAAPPLPPVDDSDALAWLSDFAANKRKIDWEQFWHTADKPKPNPQPTWETERMVALQAHVSGEDSRSAALYRKLISENGADCVSKVVSDLLMITQEKPHVAAYHFALGKAWSVLGETDKALQAYERAGSGQ